ncbi:putative quinol monooxygenase [Rugamonas sp. CCM 8940]|uniref:putative quinol monooxygenase n=1 Tax=Rugamonas sp. CCM 8940 TaxID=2765359 RepID=UPI0018F32B48|nr:putative quinol monooxygenase [Rugamonas sp. CCM 8940]MBJ7311350.1 antibiotic biosynthesis monooxygenase [Rugamonas sp. CCM 8940]
MLVHSVTFTAKPDAIPALLDLGAMLVPLSRAEPGCVRYDFLQEPHNPQRFVFFELWKSRADLDAHFAMSYFKTLDERLPSLIEGGAEILTYAIEGPKPAF